MSRSLLVPFSLPSVGPVSTDEEDAYEELRVGMLHNLYSSCVGWVVNAVISLQNEKDEVLDLKQKLFVLFPGQPRVVLGWALALYFTRKV